MTEFSADGGVADDLGAVDALSQLDADARSSSAQLPSPDIVGTEVSGDGGTTFLAEEIAQSKDTDVRAAATTLLHDTGLYGDHAPSDATAPPSDTHGVSAGENVSAAEVVEGTVTEMDARSRGTAIKEEDSSVPAATPAATDIPDAAAELL